MITVEHLSKTFGPHQALSDVSFHVKKGEVLGFLGPNGAGKTTTMRILTGYLPATSGTAKVAGYDLSTHSLEARRRLGYLPESVPLYPEMSVRGYLDFMARVKGIPRDRRRAAIDEAMEKTRVAERADQLIGKLSKGFRQRLGLAQALLGNPDVLILDEPTVGLDPKQIIETRNLIKGLGGEHTIVLSTHILPEVSMTCSRVVIVNEGRTVAEDTPENLNRRLRSGESVQLTVRGPKQQVIQRLRAVPRVISVTADSVDGRPVEGGLASYTVTCEQGSDVREQLAQAVVASGWGLLELRTTGLSLEEIFLRLTTSEEVAPA